MSLARMKIEQVYFCSAFLFAIWAETQISLSGNWSAFNFFKKKINWKFLFESPKNQR